MRKDEVTAHSNPYTPELKAQYDLQADQNLKQGKHKNIITSCKVFRTPHLQTTNV